MPRGTVQTIRAVQSSPFFACLLIWTERDIFRIRSPFDEVNIPPESGRRDGRNGIVFVRFGALSFLSIFKPCQASRSDSGSEDQITEEGGKMEIELDENELVNIDLVHLEESYHK
jgi:hypothetical protein